MLDGRPVQPLDPAHRITVPPMAGIPPSCSCGVKGGNGRDRPLLADHIREINEAWRTTHA